VNVSDALRPLLRRRPARARLGRGDDDALLGLGIARERKTNPLGLISIVSGVIDLFPSSSSLQA